MTEFAKTNLKDTNTEIHFLPVDESHTNALSREITRWPDLLFQAAFSVAVKTRG